jgi:hypothetical protein
MSSVSISNNADFVLPFLYGKIHLSDDFDAPLSDFKEYI